jgi:probable rRNA maturation factor
MKKRRPKPSSDSLDIDIDIDCRDDQWGSFLTKHTTEIRENINVLVSGHFDRPCEISLVFTRDAEIHELNKQYRGKDKPTNVLSFPGFDEDEPFAPDQHVHLGDIVMAFETIEREAHEQGKTFHDHATHMLIHGVLHLLGFDHIQEGERKEMEKIEIDFLRNIGINDPYETER